MDKEDYDEAKRVKAAVDRLRAAGGAIAGLEARKLAAVQEEDYDLAKQLKLEIDRMRWVGGRVGSWAGTQARLEQRWLCAPFGCTRSAPGGYSSY